MPVDIVYTWVDDSQPGYLDTLRKHASAPIDLNPNRTRDNLDLIKYSLRSLERHVDWRGDIYILSCRPQIPRWLKPGINNLHIIHHDEIIDNCYLPTFNSFCIISHLAKLQEVSDPFLYLEDDMLFASNTAIDDFMTGDGRLILRPRLGSTTPANKQHESGQPPWDKALSCCNSLLDRRFGHSKRKPVNHMPLMIYKQYWQEMIDTWQEAFEHTRQCRFRELYNVAPEYMYQYLMLYEQRAVMGALRDTYRKSFYFGLENNRLLTAAGLSMIRLLKPRMFCLNDNFGDNPNAGVVKMVKNFLENLYPEKSSFES